MSASRFLPAVLASIVWAAGAAGGAMAADDSGMHQFIIEEGLKRQGIQPSRPGGGSFSGSSLSHPSGTVAIAQQRTYCVRTCDGYYFAIGFARNRGQLAEHESMCAASCGTAPMKLYSSPIQADQANNGNTGPAIERAVDMGGELYTAMPTAYAFKTADTAACACQSTANGLPQIPISIDPTLRNGDIIVAQDGLKVFRGSPEAPHVAEDFVSVASAKSLPTIVRQQMLSLQNRIAD
jgi:hypothetical protein